MCRASAVFRCWEHSLSVGALPRGLKASSQPRSFSWPIYPLCPPYQHCTLLSQSYAVPSSSTGSAWETLTSVQAGGQDKQVGLLKEKRERRNAWKHPAHTNPNHSPCRVRNGAAPLPQHMVLLSRDPLAASQTQELKAILNELSKR